MDVTFELKDKDAWNTTMRNVVSFILSMHLLFLFLQDLSAMWPKTKPPNSLRDAPFTQSVTENVL